MSVIKELSNYTTLIEGIFNQFDVILTHLVYNNYHALARYLAVPLGLAISLYIIIMGLCIVQGWIKFSFDILLKTSLKMAFIYVVALNWSFFSYYGVEFISQTSAQITQIITSQDQKISFSKTKKNSIYHSLQKLFIEFTEAGAKVWTVASWRNPGCYFTALIIWGFSYVLVAAAILEILIAKMMLAILFSMAPFFVGMAIFKVTHESFNRWLGACIGFGLTMIFVAVTLGIIFNLSEWIVKKYYTEINFVVCLIGFAPIALIGFLGISIIGKAAELAQSLGGMNATISGASSLASGIYRSAMLAKHFSDRGGASKSGKGGESQSKQNTSRQGSRAPSGSGQSALQTTRQNSLPSSSPALPPPLPPKSK